MAVRCINHETGEELWMVDTGLDAGMSAMDISPDGTLIVTATGFSNPSIKVWDRDSGSLVQTDGFWFWKIVRDPACKFASWRQAN